MTYSFLDSSNWFSESRHAHDFNSHKDKQVNIRSLGLGEFVEEQGMLTSTELSLCAGLCANCFACIFHVIVTINFMSY